MVLFVSNHQGLRMAILMSYMRCVGRLRDWWTKQTVKDFEERAQCVAKQYSKYYVFDAEGNKVFVNGNVSEYHFLKKISVADLMILYAYVQLTNGEGKLSIISFKFKGTS